jgi:hypothetical protein
MMMFKEVTDISLISASETIVCLDDPAIAYDAAREFLETHADCVGMITVPAGMRKRAPRAAPIRAMIAEIK